MSATGASTAGTAAVPAPRLAFALVLLLLVWLQFGPLLGLLGFRLTGNPAWALSGGARDLLVIALLALAVQARLAKARPAPLPPHTVWLLAMLLVFGLLGLLSDGDPLVVALNLRRMLLVPLLVLALAWLPWSPAQVDRLFAAIVLSSMAVALLGLAEWLAPQALWTDWLQIEAYTAANGFDRFGSLPYTQSGRFFSGDLAQWLDRPVRRLVASYLEPTTLAAGMAALLVLAQARRARGHAAGWPLLLALLAGALTWSKGFWLFVVLLLAWRALGVPSPRMLWPLAGLGCVLALGLGAAEREGAWVHVGGLESALRHLAAGAWLGEGVGGAGNYTADAVEIGDESGLGNTIAQLGLAALLPLAWVAALARDVLATGAARRDPGAPWLAAWLMFWMLTFLYSASSQGVGGNALGFMALALYLHPASAPQRLAWPLRRRAPAAAVLPPSHPAATVPARTR